MMFSPLIFTINPITNLVMNPTMNVKERNAIHSAPGVPNSLFGLREKKGEQERVKLNWQETRLIFNQLYSSLLLNPNGPSTTRGNQPIFPCQKGFFIFYFLFLITLY